MTPQTRETPTWTRTALFGTAQQLVNLLDTGLDPNTKTGNGTTLLMMAAPDAAKVSLLLARGADSKARTTSGRDTLTIAAAYRDSAESLQAPLGRGRRSARASGNAASRLPLGARFDDWRPGQRQAALGHRSRSLRRCRSQYAAHRRLTFGYPDVARALIAAGASAHITESTGINLLHWAAITNRPEVIPLLVQAGVALDAVDENGFTPLMYGATIDFGDTRVMQALLQAGANADIRNGEGRTPLEQARHYGLAQLEARLRGFARQISSHVH